MHIGHLDHKLVVVRKEKRTERWTNIYLIELRTLVIAKTKIF